MKELFDGWWKNGFQVRSINNSAASLAILTFFLLGIVTGLLHDHLFLPHTLIQTNLDECDFEPCRAYTSQGWAFVGNAFVIAMLALRGFAALLVYFAFEAQFRRNVLLLLLIPAGFALLAVASLPYEAYIGLRVAVFICCGLLAIGAWRMGFRIVPVPLLLIATTFNPLIEVRFSRSNWVLIDLVTSAILFALAIASHKVGAYSPQSE